jgi:hypothetical protein
MQHHYETHTKKTPLEACLEGFREVPSGVKVVHFNRYNYPQTRITMFYTAHFSTPNPSNT